MLVATECAEDTMKIALSRAFSVISMTSVANNSKETMLSYERQVHDSKFM